MPEKLRFEKGEKNPPPRLHKFTLFQIPGPLTGLNGEFAPLLCIYPAAFAGVLLPSIIPLPLITPALAVPAPTISITGPE